MFVLLRFLDSILCIQLLTKEPDLLVKLFSDKLGLALSRFIRFHLRLLLKIDLLGEWKGESRPNEYVTSSDIALVFQQTDGRQV